MLTKAQVEQYHDQGWLVLPAFLDAAETGALTAATDSLVASARGLTAHTELYDLEDTHRPDAPRVRRLKMPHLHNRAFADLVRHERVVKVLEQLWGTGVRFDTSKLNMKAAGYGAPVEWHQDWAFYPHTNDDLCAVGFMLDPVDETNGPMMVVPGTHKGPVFDHHADGAFCGAMDCRRDGVDLDRAVALTGPAGSITIHHCRIVHGSAANSSGRPRRFLLHQYRAADAWPLLGVRDYDDYRRQLLSGEETITPRIEPVPVRLPLPPAPNQGSIYENQKAARARYFEPAAW